MQVPADPLGVAMNEDIFEVMVWSMIWASAVVIVFMAFAAVLP